MNYLQDLYDEQERLIDKEVHRIKQQNSTITPYLTSSFNQQFDNSLKTLIVQYQFDFDKVAVHLYFLFPVYEQKITSRTVGVRWWQLMVEDRLQRCIKESLQLMNNNEYNGQKEVVKQESQHQIVRGQYGNVEQQRSLNPIGSIQRSRVLNRLKQDNVSVYSYLDALQQSLVLQQEECERLIIYKPKFIIDSQYKLQRYEILDEQNNKIDLTIHNRQEMGIQSMLRKVVNNQFIYDEFGSFININNEESSNNRIKVQDKNINWWQQQIYSSQSSQEVDFGYQEENSIHQQGEQKQNSVDDGQKIDSNRLISQQYEIDDNWDQYQSD